MPQGMQLRISAKESEFRAAIKDMTSFVAKVGWFSSAQYPDGTQVAYVAAIQEFGSPEKNIPARPFVLPTIEEKKEQYADLGHAGAVAALTGKQTILQVLDKIGMKAEGDIAKAIEAVTDPPLSERTIQARINKKSGKIKDAHAYNTQRSVNEDGKFVYTTGGLEGDQYDIGMLGKPLIDTGLMLATLSHSVGKPGRKRGT